MDRTVFLDTSYAIALVINNDTNHINDSALSKKLFQEKIQTITTELILIEIADSLSKISFRHESIGTTDKLRQISHVVEVEKNILQQAWALYKSRSDKDWGFTDCFSFVVMKKYDIKQSLSTDKHFEQAGFEILLKLK